MLVFENLVHSIENILNHAILQLIHGLQLMVTVLLIVVLLEQKVGHLIIVKEVIE